ncbi:CIA30 family protein [uncultured Roseovarius sp.]|uniref:CIA30 family protein n=1 Tax=uncultured Roseovarius sp. TaxID=293344 RepID=UPI0026142511|nr:CIA30 family protein [uncultured Roseovarius sp.]
MRQALVLILWLISGPAMTQEGGMSNFSPPPLETWRYISDQVMGGVSEGQAEISGPEGARYLRLTGDVSTENRGGFIQVRGELERPLPEDAQGVIVRLRGNGEGYFIHLRTRGTVLPWQYYQASVPSGPEWQELRVPFTAFRPSGALLRDIPRARDIKSLAAVAYGRDHTADLSFLWIGVY